MEILTILVTGALCIVCFFVGAKVGQSVQKGKDIAIPNPVKAVTEYKESREYKKQQEQINTMMDNINNYDGTGMGQKDL